MINERLIPYTHITPEIGSYMQNKFFLTTQKWHAHLEHAIKFLLIYSPITTINSSIQ